MNSEEYATYINTYVTDYIKLADAKAASIIGVAGIVVGGVFTQTNKYLPQMLIDSKFLALVSIILLVTFLVATVLVFGKCLAALSPRLKLASNSLNSFPDISKYPTAKDYYQKVESLGQSPNSILENLSSHNWVLSKVAAEKFDNIKVALFFLKISFMVVGTLFTILIIHKVG